MMASQRSSRRGLVWAVVGGGVLLVGIVAIIVASLLSRQTPGPAPSPDTTPGTSQPSTSSSSPPDVDAVVDASVAEFGWVPEPITSDPNVYIRAALAAASTFDTTKAERPDWLSHLDSWFTPDTRYATDADRQIELDAARLELRQGVVLPEQEWDLLAASDGRVKADPVGDIVFVDVSDDDSGDMSIGTMDVLLTYTQDDGTGTEVEFEETVRVSVQVLCGPASVPTPNTDQRAGDCKVVRYFTEPLEP
ncbi:hypothetical protein ACFC3F_00445 [Microbacterium sp. NPDC055910]|uniref:hypothetical protein n=1 Tax=Microbacterium sp. NPDC055910 TaxID=3345659 RepID=UPI0035DD3843